MPIPVHIELMSGGNAPTPELIGLLRAARHWYRADTATLSGANLATLPNRGWAGGQLSVTAGTISAPAADASLNGAPSFALTGSQHLGSSFPASEWKFLHNGQGTEIFVVLVQTSLPAASSVMHVLGTSSGSYMGTHIYVTEYGQARLYATKDSYVNVSCQVSGVTAGGAFCMDGYYASSSMPMGMMRLNDTTTAQAVETYPPLDIAASQTLRVGANARSGADYLRARIAEIVIFDGVLKPYDRQVMREYVQRRYGIAAPVVPYEDRQVLRLDPFSWLRADTRVDSAGKVAYFTDKTMPGHFMNQSTAANRIDAPVADAAFGGKVVATFPGAGGPQRYASTFPSSAWKFLHGGAGLTVVSIAAPALDANAKWLLATMGGDYTSEYGYIYSFHDTSSLRNLTYGNNGAQPIANETCALPSFGSPALLVTDIKEFTGAGQSFADTYRFRTVLAESSDTTYAAAPTNTPTNTLFLGNRGDGLASTAFAGRMADVLIFTRRLSAEERETLISYVKTRYGIAP